MTAETPLRQNRGAEPASDASATWVFPPLFAPPMRDDGQSMLNQGSHSALGWQTGWAQAIGQKHRICEDSLALRWVGTLAQPAVVGMIAALGDGVGGGARGEVASHTIVRHCTQCVDEPYVMDETPQAQLSHWLALGDVEVNKALCQVTTQPGASTLAAAWLDASGQGWVSRVGDSRAYVVRNMVGEPFAQAPLLCQLLPDQTYRNLGERAPQEGQEDAPARMVGAGLIGKPEIVALQMGMGDLLLLSSDGLHQWVPAVEITRILKEEQNLQVAAHTLVAYARTQGSDDDISILLVRKV